MNNISFTSIIRPVTAKEFRTAISSIPKTNSVNYPWTTRQSVIAPDAFTTGIYDCTAAVISNGQNAIMLHLCPTNPKNFDLDNIICFIKKQIQTNLSKSKTIDFDTTDIQAIIVGSTKEKRSQDLYNRLLNFFHEFNIPTSEIKTSSKETDIAYKSSTDEFFIRNQKMDAKLINSNNHQDILNNCYEKIIISECDKIE